MKVEIVCEYCKKTVMKEVKYVNYNIKHGYKNYCSSTCGNSDKYSSVHTNCSTCGKEIDVYKSVMKRSKSGKVFCCRSHAASYSNTLKRDRSHWNYKGGASSYRSLALNIYPSKCSVCGYDMVDILEVHHKNGNRENNDPSNLDILCPTHHKEYSYGVRNYK
jgi:hypothetical protein